MQLLAQLYTNLFETSQVLLSCSEVVHVDFISYAHQILSLISGCKLGICNCTMFCCDSSFAIISMGKREIELFALFCLSSWCLVIVVWLYLAMPRVWLQFVIVVFHDHTHLLFWTFFRHPFYQSLYTGGTFREQSYTYLKETLQML